MVANSHRYLAVRLPSSSIDVLVLDADSSTFFGLRKKDFTAVGLGNSVAEFSGSLSHLLDTNSLLGSHNVVPVSPQPDFEVLRLVAANVSVIAEDSECTISSVAVALVGQHCLSLLLHPVAVDSVSIFRLTTVCRFIFHEHSAFEILQANFVYVQSLRRTLLFVLTSDNLLRLFDMPFRAGDPILAPILEYQLLCNTSGGSARRQSRGFSLAKCEPITFVSFFNSASSDGTFLALRSNGDIFSASLGNLTSLSHRRDRQTDLNLVGPLRQFLNCNDSSTDEPLLLMNASAMLLLEPSVGSRYSIPVLAVAADDGWVSHFLLLPTFSSQLQGSPKRAYDEFGLYLVERIRLPERSNQDNSAKTSRSAHIAIESLQTESSYVLNATNAGGVFRVNLPWNARRPVTTSLADLDEWIGRMGDEPAILELLSTSATSIATGPAGHLIVTDGPLLAVVASSQTSLLLSGAASDTAFSSALPQFPTMLASLRGSAGCQNLLGPTEDYVAAIQRKLSKTAALPGKLLPLPTATGNDTQQDIAYRVATGAVAVLERDYFGKTDAAVRELSRIRSIVDAQGRHIESGLAATVAKGVIDFEGTRLPRLVARMDAIRQRLTQIEIRLANVTVMSGNAASGNRAAEVSDSVATKMEEVSSSAAEIKLLLAQVNEKTKFLSEAMKLDTGPPAASTSPNFGHWCSVVQQTGDDVAKLVADVSRLSSALKDAAI